VKTLRGSSEGVSDAAKKSAAKSSPRPDKGCHGSLFTRVSRSRPPDVDEAANPFVAIASSRRISQLLAPPGKGGGHGLDAPRRMASG
jgi:hypothetical protein